MYRSVWRQQLLWILMDIPNSIVCFIMHDYMVNSTLVVCTNQGISVNVFNLNSLGRVLLCLHYLSLAVWHKIQQGTAQKFAQYEHFPYQTEPVSLNLPRHLGLVQYSAVCLCSVNAVMLSLWKLGGACSMCKKVPTWTRLETLKLIEIQWRKNIQAQLGSCKRNQKVFRKITRELQGEGYERSYQHCREKLRY